MNSIIKNAAKCKTCGEVIESTYRHDFKTCSCGKVSVDGGKDYIRRGFPKHPPEDWFEELSIFEDKQE